MSAWVFSNKGSPELRYGLMLALVEVALADEVIEEGENQALKEAQNRLKVTDEQMEAIRTFVQELKRVRERGIDDNVAAEALKHAASGLPAVGIPIAAVYFSGSVIGLSAAGITSGLAALGLGLGMVPGIGVAILLGIGVYIALSRTFDTGNKRKKEQQQADRERRAQLVVRNLQEAINVFVDRITLLQVSAEKAIANETAIQELNRRLKALQQLLAKRQAMVDGTA
jgi:hypothetical protein